MLKLAVTRIIKFKNGCTVSLDDEFALRGPDGKKLNRLETDKYIITKEKRDYSNNPDILEVIDFE